MTSGDYIDSLHLGIMDDAVEAGEIAAKLLELLAGPMFCREPERVVGERLAEIADGVSERATRAYTAIAHLADHELALALARVPADPIVDDLACQSGHRRGCPSPLLVEMFSDCIRSHGANDVAAALKAALDQAEEGE